MSASLPRAKSLPPSEPIDGSGPIRALKDGGPQTSDEFMRRYEAMHEPTT